MRFHWFVLAMVTVMPSLALGSDLLVSNVRVEQQLYTVHVTYDLATPGDVPVSIRLFLSTDGGATFTHWCEDVSGDVGYAVQPGQDRHITWSTIDDFPGMVIDQAALRVMADDTPYAADFVYIPPGSFLMGSPPDEPLRGPDEEQHAVTISRGFLMSKYEVTVQWWDEVMGSGQDTSRLPVTDSEMLWYRPEHFCNALSNYEGLTPAYSLVAGIGWEWDRSAEGYRLPTEAEWEYACRAGTETPFNNGTNCLSSETEANFFTHPFYPYPGCPHTDHVGHLLEVGTFPPNAWGLYDMHGNILEYVQDSYLEDYNSLPATDPVYEEPNGANRTARGGYYTWYAHACRSAKRQAVGSKGQFGFRPVRTLFENQTLGTIYIDPRPSELRAPWSLTGPGGYHGDSEGYATLTGLAAGSYTIVWGPVSGWQEPESSTQVLPQGGTSTFSGMYSSLNPNLLRGGPEETEPLAIPVQITGADGAGPYNANLHQWTGDWQAPQAIYDHGSFVNDPENWSNILDNPNSGSTWVNPTPGTGYGILVVDLGQVRAITLVSVFQMFSEGKTTQIALAEHPSETSTPPDAFDSGWNVFLPRSAVGPGEDHGTFVSAPSQFVVNASTRYVQIMAYNDGSLGNQLFINLKGVKLYSEVAK